MIVGIGTDIIEICRIKEKIDRGYFLKVFSKREIENIKTRGDRVETYAGIFAAKEAIYKSLSSLEFKISIKDIEILNKMSGEPYVIIESLREEKFKIKLSISHSDNYAIAFAICEK